MKIGLPRSAMPNNTDRRIWTLELTESQLDRVQDLVAHCELHIIHLLYDDLRDHYVTLVECDSQTYTWLCLN